VLIYGTLRGYCYPLSDSGFGLERREMREGKSYYKKKGNSS